MTGKSGETGSNRKGLPESQKRSHSPPRDSGTAGLASASKNGQLPYGRRFPAAHRRQSYGASATCCRDLQYLRPFFWDVDFQKLSIKESSYFIISRLMEHGDEKAFIFLLKNYSQKEMIHVLKNSRSLSRRSRGFWKIFFDVENELCTPKRYPTPYGNCSED